MLPDILGLACLRVAFCKNQEMSKPKLIEINLGAAKHLVRILKRNEELNCVGCEGELHQADCPAKEMFQLRNYLTQRINNPNRKFGI